MTSRLNALFLGLICLLTASVTFAGPVTLETATKVANAQILRAGKGNDVTLKNIIPVSEASMVYFYAVELSPVGYMIIAADDDLPPVIAYSYQDKLDTETKFFSILKYDMAARLESIKKVPAEKIKARKHHWNELIDGTCKLGVLSQQWPPAGTTSTGGWLETNWTQTSPYNLMCPIDPVTSSRSYTGCPATAMAQIVNYHRTTNNTYFDDSDDYYHNYSGRTFWIDDDYDQHGFPSYPQLNVFLDTLNQHYQNNTTLTNDDKAALTFACGVAATQVYTSGGSGTFSVTQAYDAYLRFGFSTVELLYDSDTSLYTRLSQNMKDSLPAHLALVDAAWSTGHNVVVDGYNTDNYYHVNFGWGGSNNGWYLLPDEMPYSLTVVEGLIVDIIKNGAVSVHETEAESNSAFRIYPNPAAGFITVEHNDIGSLFTISDMEGRVVLTETVSGTKKQVDISDLSQGIYIVKLQGKERSERLVVIR